MPSGNDDWSGCNNAIATCGPIHMRKSVLRKKFIKGAQKRRSILVM